MVGLTGIGEGRRCHGHLQQAEHIVKPANPVAAVDFFRHGKVHGDAQEHLLRRLHGNALAGADDIALQQQGKSGIVKQVVPLRADPGGKQLDFLLGVGLQNIVSVKSLLGEIYQFFIKACDVASFQRFGKVEVKPQHKKPCGNILPAGSFLGGSLHCGLDEHIQLFFCGKTGFCKGLEFGVQQL